MKSSDNRNILKGVVTGEKSWCIDNTGCVENRFCNMMHEYTPVFFTLIPKIMFSLLNDHRLVKYEHILKNDKILARCR